MPETLIAGEVRFDVDPFTSCVRCDGLGRLLTGSQCDTCHGTGIQQPPWVGAVQ